MLSVAMRASSRSPDPDPDRDRGGRTRLACWACAALVVATGLLAGPGSSAARAAPQVDHELVDRYAPILRLRKQEDPPCDTTEEQYQPTSVETVLGNPRVQLVFVHKRKKRVIKSAPTAEDIADLSSDYYLNLPGDPVESECVYSRDFAGLKRDGMAPAVTYARIAGEPGVRGLVVQYWFFYYFNQFNDLHEGDWEGMQIAFHASTPAEALARGPYEIVLFQHAGGETADWDDDNKLERQGTHPIVYPAAGSHATFYDDATFLETGSGGSGLGCDNTTEPLRTLRPRPVLVPTNPSRRDPFPWLTYNGHWGQKDRGFNNGPSGPNTKTVWREPFTWMDGARLASPTLPSGGFLGPTAAQAFCGAVAAVSTFINVQSRSPTGVLLLLAIVAVLLLLPVVLTRWRPVDLTRLRQPRRFGQLIRSARQFYGRHWRTFVAIGLCAPLATGAIEGLQALYTEAAGQRNVNPAFSIGGAHFELSFTIAGTLQPLALTVIAAAVVASVAAIDRGQRGGFAEAWTVTFGRFWRLVFARLFVTVVLFALFITIIGIPFAIWKFVEWQLVQQEIVFEDKSIRDAMRGSSRLVRHHWLRTLLIAGFLSVLNAAVGPVLGFFLIFANFSLVAVDLVSALVYALLVPYVAIARTLLYFDLAARRAEREATSPRRRWFRSRPSPQVG
jgi:hypothetical protein